MTAETIIAGVAVIGVLFTGGGLIVTWRRNGRELRERDLKMAKEQAARDATINTNQQNIIDRLDNDETGLTALNQKVGGIQTHCASVTSGFGERIKGTEVDIKELKSKKSRSRS